MSKIFKIGSAFIGIIIGAGAASGREIVQYFTSFGMWGVFGGLVSTALFMYLGMMLTRLGSRLNAKNHKEVIYKISGRWLGLAIDWVIILTLFGVGTVMIAGAGSNLQQQFGLHPAVGNTLIVLLILGASLMNVDRVIHVIGFMTPFLLLTVIGASIYSLLSMDSTFAQLDPIAKAIPTTLPNWLYSGINYVSFNIAVGASMSIVMGGVEEDERAAAWGGIVGGIGLGVLIILSHLAIFSQIEYVGESDMPMLLIVNNISPILGIFMSIILFAMIFNTGLGMFYAFGARFFDIGTKKFVYFLIGTLFVGFGLSFVGFKDLVAHFYPLIGNMGLLLVVVLIFTSFRMPEKVERE